MAKLFVVIYRTGGTVNFKWHRGMAYESQLQAIAVKQDVERQGYKALVADYHQSLAVGLPETFEA